MSYTSTIERMRRRKPFRGSDDFTTDNRFVGQAVTGTASVIERAITDTTDLNVSVHVDKEAVVEAVPVKGTLRDFVTVDIATYRDDLEMMGTPEAIVFLSVEQARALRDSLIALDI